MKIISRIRNLIVLILLFIACGCNPTKNREIRILTAGIRHESNTFMPYLTEADDFMLLRGDALTRDHSWAEFLEEEKVKIIPTLYAGSGPSGMVSRQAYEAFRDEILEAIREALPVDGIYLDMHGALHVEAYPVHSLISFRRYAR